MLKHELYKVFANKTAVVFIGMLLMLNIVQLVYLENESNRWTTSAYNEAWEDITEAVVAAKDEAGTVAQNWLTEKQTVVMLAMVSKDDGEKVTGTLYTGDEYIELKLLSRMQTEVDFSLGYNDYLAGVEEAAKRYELLSVFSEPDGYAYRDIMKMQKLYGKLSEKTIIPAPSAGIRLATHSDMTDILALVFLLFLTVTVWLKEREQNMLLLLRTAKNGRVRLASAKLLTLIVACAGAGIILYGSNLIVAGIMYNLGDFSRPLASVYEYGHTLWEISVGEFVLLNILFKILSYIFIMLLLSVICLCLKSSIAAFAGIILLGAAGCLMYYKIPALSVWAAFKYLNPFAVLKTEMLFEGYKGLNFFGYPMDYRYCIVGLFAVGYVAFIIFAVKLFCDYIIKGSRSMPKALMRAKSVVVGLRRKLEKHTSLLFHEMHRVFIYHGVLVIIGIALVLVISDARPETVRYINEKYYYYAKYLKVLEGPVTEEKLAYIEVEEERVKNPADDTDTAKKDALKWVRERLVYLEENDGAYFIYDEPHNKLVAGSGNNSDFMWAIYVMILLVLCMPCFFAPDLQNGMYRVIEVTAKGRKRLRRMRYVFGTVLAIMFVLMVHLSKFIQQMVVYEVKGEVFSYPANSMPHLEKFSGISVGAYYVLLYMLWIVSAVMGAFLMHRLARRIKSPAYTMLAGMVILMFPLLIAVYNRELIYAAYPHSLFAGNLFLQNSNAAIVCVVIWGLFFMIDRIITGKHHFGGKP